MAWDDTRTIDVGRTDGKLVVMNSRKLAEDLVEVGEHLSKRDFLDLQEALIDALSDVKYPNKKKKTKVRKKKKVPKKKKVIKKSKKVLVKKKVV